LNFFEFGKKEEEKKNKPKRKKTKTKTKKKISEKWARPVPDQGCAMPGRHRLGRCIEIP
jgi:hypothetical protein